MDTSSTSISPDELSARIGRPDAPLVIDVRRRARFDESAWLLPGARHCAPEDVPRLAAGEPPGEAVVYCVYGHEVSHDAAATLSAAGWRVRWLEGGIEGGEPGVDDAGALASWRAAPVPRIRKRPDLGVAGERPSRWITRARPKIDRVACPWLILRFIDPRAEFFYVPEDQVFAQARVLGAVPYDIAGAPVTHEWERCSFDALMRAFELDAPGLAALADIVRAADTDRLGLSPQAPGLLAISLGLSRLYAEDDHAMLRAALPVYDALYAWCREGQDEKHFWKAHQALREAA